MTPTTGAQSARSDSLSLTAVGYSAQTGRWRTEAMRSHASPRLLFIAKGQGRITIAGLTSGYGPNNLIYIPAGTMYGYEVGPTVFGQMLTIPRAMAAEWPEEPTHLRLRDVTAQKELAGLFDNLERELQSGKSGHSRAAHYHLGIMSVFFERMQSSQPVEADRDRSKTASARLVAAYSDLVERDFRSKTAISGYAAALGVTPTHLTRCCRQTCGRSALAIPNDRVLYEARVMLRESRTPVQEIAKSLGFASPAYFTRSFQQATGLTPTGFRRGAASPAAR